MTTNKTVNLLGTFAIAMLLTSAGTAVAREGQGPRMNHKPRVTQPHTRTVERQRTETGRTRRDTITRADGSTATRNAEVKHDRDTGTTTRNVDYTGFDGQSRSVDSVRTRTDDGFTRSTTVTNAEGETATRNLDVSRDKDAGTITREASYTTADGREGSMSDVIQRTEDGFTRDTTRIAPDGRTHTRAVEVACDKDARKCVKQVEVGQKP